MRSVMAVSRLSPEAWGPPCLDPNSDRQGRSDGAAPRAVETRDRCEGTSPATGLRAGTERDAKPTRNGTSRLSRGNCLGLDRETRSAHLARRNKPLQSLALDTS